MGSLITMFRDMPDARTGNARRHEPLDILTIALAASARSAESCADFAKFAADRETLLREFLRPETALPNFHQPSGRYPGAKMRSISSSTSSISPSRASEPVKRSRQPSRTRSRRITRPYRARPLEAVYPLVFCG